MRPIAISLAALIALAILVVFALLSGHSAVGSAPVQARHVPPVVSRSVQRPWLTLVASVAPATAQTSPSASSASASEPQVQQGARSVATVGPVVGKGKPSTGPTTQQWQTLRRCESGDNYTQRANPLYRGAYQIGYREWDDFGGYHDPAEAPPALQDARALQMWQARGWQPWAASSACTGLQ